MCSMVGDRRHGLARRAGGGGRAQQLSGGGAFAGCRRRVEVDEPRPEFRRKGDGGEEKAARWMTEAVGI